MKVEQPVIFISDGDNPFGAAILRRFAARRGRIIVNTRTRSAVRGDIAEGRAEVLPIDIDLCSRPAVEAMLDELTSDSAPIGIFLHTGNTSERCDVESCTQEQFDRSVRENLKSAFVCTQAVGGRMVERGSGRIIYLGSIHGEKPTRSAFAYSVAKGALTMLCREAALELGRGGVCVNLIEMGPIEGDNERFGDELFPLYDSYRAKVPGRVIGTAEDAANLAWFLASKQARYLNGASVRLDGGFLLHYIDQKVRQSAPAPEGRHR